MKRSVLFDARLILDRPTGIGQYVTSLVPELLSLAPDWHVHLLRRPRPWPGYGVARWKAPNMTHHTTNLAHMTLRQHLVLPRLARELQVNLIHYPHFDAPVVLGSIPVVATIHDVKYLVHPEFFTDLGWLKRRYMQLCFAQTLQHAGEVITVSRTTARDLQRIFGVEGQRLQVIYEGVSPRFEPAIRERQTAVRKKYGLQRPFILTVGERRPHKNHATLIRAFSKTRCLQTHDLVIVGQTHHNYHLPEKTTRDLGLASQVRFLSDVENNDLIALYTAAELFVLASLYEGFGLPILEAMACGTPVITSSTTASGEVAGRSAMQVNPRDADAIAAAIDRMLESTALQRLYVGRGCKRSSEFTWRRAARETLNLYRKVLENEQRRP